MAKRKLPQPVLKYIKYLREHYQNIDKVYLFGSYIKENDTIESDIDIAVIFDKVNDSFDLQVQLMKIRRQYDTRIEPHVFSSEDFNDSHPFANEVIRTGVELE